MIDRVTITGPDDSIKPADLIPLTEEFPFVEWGILVSAGNVGSPRFPSMKWMAEMRELQEEGGPLNHAHVSLHLCGRWVRKLLLGIVEIPTNDLPCHDRMQLNFHAENTPCDPEGLCSALWQRFHPREFIFQIDGNGGNAHLDSLWDWMDKVNRRMSAVALFDVSGGAGILPREWPKPIWLKSDSQYAYHGYAGGLGPDNLAEQIPLILEAAGPNCPHIWIDMETKVRSGDDRQFDLSKVRKCLEIAQSYVK